MAPGLGLGERFRILFAVLAALGRREPRHKPAVVHH